MEQSVRKGLGAASVERGSTATTSSQDAWRGPSAYAMKKPHPLAVGFFTLTHPEIWPTLNIQTLDESTVGKWITQNTDRDNFYFTEDKHPVVLSLFEIFLHSIIKPLFEV